MSIMETQLQRHVTCTLMYSQRFSNVSQSSMSPALEANLPYAVPGASVTAQVVACGQATRARAKRAAASGVLLQLVCSAVTALLGRRAARGRICLRVAKGTLEYS